MWSWRFWGLNQITWEVSFKESRQFPQNDPWIFNHLFLLVTKGYSLTFESSVSKIWFDSLLKFSIIACFLHIEIIVIILLIFSQKLNTKMYLAFIGKEISGTIIFPVFIEKTRPGHNCSSESFINEGRLVTPNLFFLYWSMDIKYFRVKCWRDSSWNVVNNALLQWLKFLYYMILGLRFEWNSQNS